MNEQLAQVIEDLKRAHGDALLSVILFGSAARGEYREGRSDFNLLVVLKHITPDDLRAAQPAIEPWQDEGHPLPLYFTQEELASGSDVFPIEFLDMSRFHQVLHGPDPFDGLTVSRANLRHQLEYELRGKLIRLRELFIPAGGEPERLTALMVDSIASFLVLFRHVLGLMGEEPPVTRLETVHRLGERLGVDVGPFLKVMTLSQNRTPGPMGKVNEAFAAYLEAIESVVQKVDKLVQS